MKESLQGIDKTCILHESWDSEDGVRSRNILPYNLSFSQGVATLNGSSAYATFTRLLNGVYSIRFRLTALSPSAIQYLLDCRSSSGTGYIRIDSATAVSASSGTIYVDGVATSAISSNSKEIVVTGITLVSILGYIGRINTSGANYLNGSIDLWEIYNTTLFASMITNLKNNAEYKPLAPRFSLILSVDALSGVIQNRANATAIVNTAVNVVRSGSIWSMLFPSSGASLSLGSYNSLTGDLSLIGWIFPLGYGTSNAGKIIDNTKLKIGLSNTNSVLNVSSDGSTVVSGATNGIVIGRWQHIAVTRTSAGVVNIYINGVLSGSANQASGTPASGSTIYLGAAATSNYFNGRMGDIEVFQGILSQVEIAQKWSSEKSKFNL